MKSNSSRNLGYILMGIGLVLVALGIYGLLRPNEFKAQARIKLERFDAPVIESPEPYNPYFVQMEIETIRSDPVLSNVLFRLDLNSGAEKRLRSSKALTSLRERLDVHPYRSTTLLDICVVNEDAVAAAKIANTIAEVYSDWRLEKGRRLVAGGIDELVKQLKLQEQRTQKAEDNLEGLRKALAIPSPEPSDDFLKTNFPAYAEAKRNLDETKDIERLIARKIKVEQEYLSIPIDSQVRIIEHAVPASAPSGHQRELGVMLLVVGLAIFSSGIVIVQNSKAADATSPAQNTH